MKGFLFYAHLSASDLLRSIKHKYNVHDLFHSKQQMSLARWRGGEWELVNQRDEFSGEATCLFQMSWQFTEQWLIHGQPAIPGATLLAGLNTRIYK